MRRTLCAAGIPGLAAVVVATALALPTRDSGALPGASATKVCAAAGPYWPTMTRALRRTSAWVACKEQSRVVRVDTRTGTRLRSVRLGGPVIAVASGFASVWALESGGVLDRLNATTGKVTRRISLGTAAAYNVWIGGGSVWVADDQGASVVRVSPKRSRVVARLAVGDGPADIAFGGGSAWVVNHRDRVLSRIDLATNRSSRLAVLPGDAPERMVSYRGRLWITGRGTDLLEVDPADGSVVRTIEIGASGIDVVAAGGRLWVPTRNATGDRGGFPTMDALKRVSPESGEVSVVARPLSRVDVHGLAAGGGAVWVADNTNGFLYRVPESG